MPESSYWQLCPPSSKSGLQGGLLSSSFPPGPNAHLQEGVSRLDPPPLAPPPPPLAPPPPPPPPPKRHCRSLSVPEDLSRCRYTWRPSASRVWTPVSRTPCHGGGVGGGPYSSGGGASSSMGGACRAPSSSLNSSLHSSSSPTFFSLALSPDSPLPWSFPWDPSEAASGGGACCCFFPSSCSSSPSPLIPPPPPQRRFSLSPVLIRDSLGGASSSTSSFLPPHPPPIRPRPPSVTAGGGGALMGASPSSACSTPSSLRRSLPPPLPRCHSQPCDLLLLKPGLKRRRDPERPPARPLLDFTKMTQTRSMDPQALDRCGGRLLCGVDLSAGMESFLGDFRRSCSPAECLGRNSIGPLSESDEEECREDEEEEEEDDGDEEEEAAAAAQQNVFERDCTELDLNLIEEN
ncbi:LOW QUALITY PROTEIN: protein FAM53C-like [Trematomus bernacchii]|nr:LOW QUALITY PROTEIN: protein FAM53C-like [Trematomus bernacchii]